MKIHRHLPGGPVVKTLSFYRRGHGSKEKKRVKPNANSNSESKLQLTSKVLADITVVQSAKS